MSSLGSTLFDRFVKLRMDLTNRLMYAIIDLSKKRKRIVYTKLLPNCYIKGIDKSSFFCDNRPINKSW
jgi:hypothetical protein